MSARPKVLHMTHWYPTAAAPVDGIFNRETAKAAALVADTQVLHCAGPDPRLRGLWRLEEERDLALSAGIPTVRAFHRPLPPHVSYGAFVWAAVGAYRALARRGFRPDVIHAAVYPAAVPAVLIGRATGIPVVVMEYSSGYARGLHNRINRAKARFALQQARRVLVPAIAQQRAIEGTGIRARFELVPPAVDLDLFTPPEVRPEDGPARLLFVGRLDAAHVKGVPVLLDAVARLGARRSDWHLEVAGDGPARAGYERKVEALKLAKRVTFRGALSRPAVAELMQRATMLVLATPVWDTAPNVIAEAHATGLPVVATRVGGIPEMVSETSGILVAPNDPDALAEGLDRALDQVGSFDPETIAAAARETFGLPAVGARLAALYETVVAGG